MNFNAESWTALLVADLKSEITFEFLLHAVRRWFFSVWATGLGHSVPPLVESSSLRPPFQVWCRTGFSSGMRQWIPEPSFWLNKSIDLLLVFGRLSSNLNPLWKSYLREKTEVASWIINPAPPLARLPRCVNASHWQKHLPPVLTHWWNCDSVFF
jgi:hypothetical protein